MTWLQISMSGEEEVEVKDDQLVSTNENTRLTSASEPFVSCLMLAWYHHFMSRQGGWDHIGPTGDVKHLRRSQTNLT